MYCQNTKLCDDDVSNSREAVKITREKHFQFSVLKHFDLHVTRKHISCCFTLLITRRFAARLLYCVYHSLGHNTNTELHNAYLIRLKLLEMFVHYKIINNTRIPEYIVVEISQRIILSLQTNFNFNKYIIQYIVINQ